jgi:hypothetical protein
VSRARAKTPKVATAGWIREAWGVVAFGLAVYLTAALLSYDPTLHWLDQEAQVGVVGLWIGWAAFRAFGHAGYLVPLALVVWGVSAFYRPLVAASLSTLAGVGFGLVALTGLLARLSGPSAGVHLHRGGVLGRAVGTGLRQSVGDVGSLVVLVTLLAVAGLCLTHVSYAGLSRSLAGRLGRLVRRRPRRAPAAAGPIAEGDLPTIAVPAAPRLARPRRPSRRRRSWRSARGRARPSVRPPGRRPSISPGRARPSSSRPSPS